MLQNRRGPNQEGSKFFLIRRGPNPEGSCFHKTGGVPIRRGLNFADPEGSYFCQSGGVLFFVNPEGYYFIKGLRQIEEMIIVRGNRLLGARLGTSDCIGNLPLKKDQTKIKQVQTPIFATLSQNKKRVCNSLVWIEIQNVFEKNDFPEDFSRSSSGIPKANR